MNHQLPDVHSSSSIDVAPEVVIFGSFENEVVLAACSNQDNQQKPVPKPYLGPNQAFSIFPDPASTHAL
ncbi:hypothetical protein Mapa_005073 [Marchantia paleacea]|nr:hypothetical protein Mapa_005073 [Marchantia paleacea]